MLFEFQLRPIEQVAPWGKEGEYSLSWFGLTDGWYWLKCGEEELFRYADELIKAWAAKGMGEFKLPYVDYHVVRLWEDILQMLPEILNPIPKHLLQKIEPGPLALQWCSQISEAVFTEEHEVSKLVEDRFIKASSWLSDRKLDVGYLLESPRIWFWTDGKLLFVRWDNEGRNLEGHHAWASANGTYTMPLEAFVDEVRSFDKRLIKAMEERVQTIEHSWERPDIQIDVNALINEHQKRSTELSFVLDLVKNREATQWNEIAEAIKYFEEMGFAIPKAG